MNSSTSLREAQLIREIGTLKYHAWKRRELHDDPVSASELEEEADAKAEELFNLSFV